ncbi:DNA/RNA endonuclease G, NUC1 [Acidovorax sp. CF316]|nr:DNA/RNA endonuclease G, NUC1 [Acidovorax sp. CF316]
MDIHTYEYVKLLRPPRQSRGVSQRTSIVFARAPNPAFEKDSFRVPQPTSFAHFPQFFVHGKPPAVPTRPLPRALCYEAFAVLHSGETRTLVYVAQRLNRRVIEQTDHKRADKFFADARLPGAELGDYKRSGYSRGHMAPAGDMSTPTAMAQNFSLANMVPQNIQHTGGPWAKIEEDTRRYVLRAQGRCLCHYGAGLYAHQPVHQGEPGSGAGLSVQAGV